MLLFGLFVIIGTLLIIVFCIAALCQVICDKLKTISTEEQLVLSKMRSNPRPQVEFYSPATYRMSDIDNFTLHTKGKVRIYKRTITETSFIEIDE
jgi:hypothetical protein